MVPVTPAVKDCSFFLTDINQIQRLRIDPFQYAGTGAVGRVTLTQKGYEPISVFPLFPMFGLLISRTFAADNSRILTLGTLHLFLLSFYSYVFIALPAIPRRF